MTASVGSSTALAVAIPFPEIPVVQVCPASQGPKRYLKDFPDSAKTYIPAERLTEVKDDFGNILEVPDALKDKPLVLEDPSETRLQKLARVYVLTSSCTAKSVALQRQMEAEFPYEEVHRVIQAAYDETHALRSPQVRALAETFVQYVETRRHLLGLGLDPDNLPKKEVAFWDATWNVICSYGDEISSLYSTTEREHPRIVMAAKVAAVAALVFFCLYALRYSFLITQTSLLVQNNNAID